MPAVPENVRVFSVTELTAAIEETLRKDFTSLWVSGEVANVSKPQSGHVYFSLRDAKTTIGAVMYRGVALRQKFDLTDGMEVLVRGRINIYAPQGKYQLSVEELQPKGIGAQELALRQLKEKLLTRGYFDPRRKKKLPAFPRVVALVTSPSGAAVRDMLQVLTTRWPFCDVIVCPVRVQGAEASDEIAAAVALLNRLHAAGHLRLDVLLVGRGGGSAEDLDAFNAETVADAIFASRIPVVSAVGHEIDVSIADLVADARALTPTDAANQATPDHLELLQGLREYQNRLEDAVRHKLELGRQRLDDLAKRGAFRLPLERVRESESRLDEIAGRLHRVARQKLLRAGEMIAALAGRLETLSPLNVLSRGYSLTRTEGSRELVRDVSRITPGDRLLTTTAGGEVVSRVEEVRRTES
jgi:exodeoxyribonuclease VII large subunit